MKLSRRTGTVVGVAVVALLLLGGLGYAVTNSIGYVNTNATAGSFELVIADGTQCVTYGWSTNTCVAGEGPGGSGSPGNTFYIVSCTPSPGCLSAVTITSGPSGLGTQTVTLSMEYFAPGGSVTLGYWIYNEGSLPASLVTEGGTVNTKVCDTIWNIGSLTGPASVPAGTATGPWEFSITLASLATITTDGCAPPNTPNYLSGPATVELTVTGTAS